MLWWGNPEDIQSVVAAGRTVDVVLLADCVYYRDALKDLVKTIVDLASSDHTEVLLRKGGREFFRNIPVVFRPGL